MRSLPKSGWDVYSSRRFEQACKDGYTKFKQSYILNFPVLAGIWNVTDAACFGQMGDIRVVVTMGPTSSIWVNGSVLDVPLLAERFLEWERDDCDDIPGKIVEVIAGTIEAEMRLYLEAANRHTPLVDIQIDNILSRL